MAIYPRPVRTGLESARDDWKTRSYWATTVDYTPTDPLQGDRSADVVIIGGGFTGQHAAQALREEDPGLDIVIVDAAVCGYGGSSRNGGFMMTMVDRGLADFARDVGDMDARDAWHAIAAEMDEIEKLCIAEGVDADIRRAGIYTVSNGPEQDERVAEEYETAQRLGLPGFRYLDREEITSHIHSNWFRCATFEDTCRLLNPAKLVWGLRDISLRRGVAVHEMSPVRELIVDGGGVSVVTDGGRVRADRALVATNAFCSALPDLRRYLMTFYAYIILTRPLTDEQWSRVGWHDRAGVEDRRVFHHYVRPTVDGRILWGGRDAPFVPGEPDPAYDRNYPDFGRLEETFRHAFPQLEDVEFEHRWGGPVAATASFLPFVGWWDDARRVVHAVGYTGHGVGPSRLIGRTAADLLLGRDTARTHLVFARKRPQWLPREPFRKWVVSASSNLLQRADDHSNAGPMGKVLDVASKYLK